MESAIFVVPTPLVLEKVVTQLDSIPMKERDTKGDVYEYMLYKLSTSGEVGQIRTCTLVVHKWAVLQTDTSESARSDHRRDTM